MIKEEKNNYLEIKAADLESRMDECETYLSKERLIVQNSPITNDINVNLPPLTHQECDFLKQYVNYETHPSNFKACHHLRHWKNEKYAPAKIVKLI